MMNLKSPEKKLYFKILLHVGVLTLISCGIVLLVQTMNIKEDTYRDQRDSIINSYNIKIQQKDSINKILVEKQHKLESEIDSLENVKGIVIKDYDKKINYIYDASAINHAMWLDSIIAKVNSVKQ